MADIQEKTMKDLVAEAIEVGIPEEKVKTFKSKASLQVMIDTVSEAKAAVPEVKVDEEVKKVDSIIEKPNDRDWETVSIIT